MRKYFGGGKTDICPFCGDTARIKNKEGLNVCPKHKISKNPTLKCTCGEYLEVLAGKYGNYCNCLNCGNITMKKALERT